jgi:hypothetical protein
MGKSQASPLAIVIAIVVLLVVLFVIYKLTLGKGEASDTGAVTPGMQKGMMGNMPAAGGGMPGAPAPGGVPPGGG